MDEHALVRAEVVSLGTLRADTPAEMVASATRIATPLAEVIETQKLYTMIGGKKHVRVEGWTTVAMMCGATAYEVSNVGSDDGTYVATVELRRLVDG